jgi:signal transduction histidine kinase
MSGHGLAWAGEDTGDMLRWVNWLARILGFAWIGVVMFVVSPPHGSYVLPVQVAGYCLAGLAIAGWIWVDTRPRSGLLGAVGLPLFLGLLAVATGFTSAAGFGGSFLAIYGFVATLAAGADVGLAPALAVTAAGVLATEVSALAFGGNLSNMLGLPAVLVSGVLIGRNRAAYRIQAEQSAALLAQREQLEAEQRRADLLDERTRIAREIHDVLAHSLGALGIQIQAARSVLTDKADIDQASDLLAAAQRMAAEGLAETRRAVHALRTDTLPLNEELAKVTGIYGQRYGVAVSFDIGGAPRPLPPDATVALLRIAQEALVNAAKHAAGQQVTMRLDYSDSCVMLTVSNPLAPGSDGPPAVSTLNGGYGLTGMRERLRMLNGTLEAGRRDGQWIVTARLPRPEPDRTRPENIAS